MRRKRRKFSTKFKVKVVLEALKERETMAQLAIKYDIHQNQISKWKKEFLANADQAFDGSGTDKAHDAEVDKLYRKIGELNMENEWLKKNL